MYTTVLKNGLLGIVILALVFGSGAYVTKLYYGNEAHERQLLLDDIKKEMRKYQKENAQLYEDLKNKVDETSKSVKDIKLPKILEKKIYHNYCLEEEGVNVLVDYKKESAKYIRGEK